MHNLIRLGGLVLALGMLAACGGGGDIGNGFMPRTPIPGPSSTGP